MSERDDSMIGLAEAMADPAHPLKVEVSEWAAQHLARRDLVADDQNLRLDLDDWQRCAERGLLGLFVPEELGGSGTDLATALLSLEGLGHGCSDNGLTYAIASQLLSTQIALLRFANDEQRQRWLPGLLEGTSFGAFAITELEAGSAAFEMTTSAEQLADGSYRLNGHKAFITFAPLCDFCIVFASTRPEAGRWGISAFIVDTSAPGVQRGQLRPKMGMRTTPFGDLSFNDVIIGPESILGREGAGASIFTAVIDVERSYVFAPQVGAMERQLEATIEFARTCVQGGQAIAGHQAVAHRIVSMKERHERARLFLYRAALAEASGHHVPLFSSLAKLVGCDTGIESSLDASLIHGVRGFATEFEIERALRDSIGGLTYSGSTDVLRNVVARLLSVG